MPTFSKKSIQQLDTCDKQLVILFNCIVNVYDCTIIEGHRNDANQNRYYDEGKSKFKAGEGGKHNMQRPSLAVDVAPYPIDWNNLIRFYHFGGYVCATARCHRINLRWGGDWDDDYDLEDQNFNDLVHFELVTS